MRVPVVNLPTVYHVGTLDPAHRGRQWASSHEGAGLSVSLCPAGWERIARLGGKPWQELTRHDALFIDLGAIDDALLAEIQGWAREADLLGPRLMWRAWSWDDEAERWGHMLFGSREEAIGNLPEEPEEGEDEEAFLDRLADEQGLPPGASAPVEDVAVWTLTEAGSPRAASASRDVDGTDLAVMFWAEDVLRASMPEIVGVWWPEEHDPDALSAPRGAILPGCVGSFAAREVARDQVDEDEDLLLAMPQTRLVEPSASGSGYVFVTDCVRSTADLICPMVDSPADREMGFEEFARELGNGDLRAGRRILDAAFPEYRRSGMDIAEDYHVRYRASSFDGMPCLYVVHSAIEHVFQRRGFREAPRIGGMSAAPEAWDGPDQPSGSRWR